MGLVNLNKVDSIMTDYSYNSNPINSSYNGYFNFGNLQQTPIFNFYDVLNSTNSSQNYSQKVAGSGSKFKYTASSQQIMRNAGQYFHKKGTYTPKRGDIAIWTSKANAGKGHVGIVTKIEGDTIWITEGNSGNAVKTNKYSLSKLMSNSGSRPLNGFIDAHSWLGSDTALKAADRAEKEQAKGVVESSKNDSADIRKYKRGAKNSQPWCGSFTSYCFTDGQNLNAIA